MKLVLATFLLLSVSACDYGARRQVTNLKDENQSLQNQLQLSSVYIQDVTEMIDEVQKNLNKIELREGIIGRISLESEGAEGGSRRRSVNIRRELLTSISDIDSFIEDNRRKMDVLNARISESAVRIESLDRLVENLTVSVQQKEENISQLKMQVQLLEANVASLQGELQQREVVIQEKDSTIAQQEAAIQTQREQAATAYYVIGNRETLKKAGLIRERRSGFLGLKKHTSVGSVLTEYFTGVYKTQPVLSFSQSIKKIEVVSAHRDRPDLFQFDRLETGANLVIKDPERFWAISDYLVIVSKD